MRSYHCVPSVPILIGPTSGAAPFAAAGHAPRRAEGGARLANVTAACVIHPGVVGAVADGAVAHHRNDRTVETRRLDSCPFSSRQ